jgi:hypothetical protein
VWRWLVEAKLVFMCVFAVLAAILFGFFTFHSEESIRVVGYVLQLIGMIFAIRGLLGIREYFGQPLLIQLVSNWVKRFPRWKRNVVIAAGTAHMTMSGMKARGEVWTPDDPEKPIEHRIDGIIRNLDRIREEQREQAHSIDDLKDSHEEHKKQVAEEQNSMKEKILTDLESLHTSDLVTSLVGLVWLTVGITMSTLAPELSKWLY